MRDGRRLAGAAALAAFAGLLVGCERAPDAREPGKGRPDAPLGVELEGARYFKASDLDVRPRPLAPVEPAIPPGSEGRSGHVVARILIEADGRPKTVRIESSDAGAAFDEEVVKAFGAVRYQPGVKNGIRVRSQMRIEVTLHAAAKPGPAAKR